MVAGASRSRGSAAALAATALTLAAWAGKAHEHGVAWLDVGVEAGRVTLSLEVPLESLVGFERAPRTEAERAAVTTALARLGEVDRLVRIDGAAGRGAGKVLLVAPMWGIEASPAAAAGASSPAPAAPARAPSAPAAPAALEGHGELEATFEFRCSSAPRAGHVEVGLFEAFGAPQGHRGALCHRAWPDEGGAAPPAGAHRPGVRAAAMLRARRWAEGRLA